MPSPGRPLTANRSQYSERFAGIVVPSATTLTHKQFQQQAKRALCV
jgi:hypothetical protein